LINPEQASKQGL